MPQPITQTKALALENTQQFRWVMTAGTLVILLGGFWYLLLSNSLATMGFNLEELKSQNLVLQKQIEQQDISMAIPTSLYALESYPQVQNMDSVKSKQFVMVAEGEVAFLQTK